MGKRNVLFQDNESCIKLANNGKASSSRRTRHINIRYFFVTDRVKNKEIEIHYCPTKEVIGDFFTKPLQGALFMKFRNSILGITAEDCPQYKEDMVMLWYLYRTPYDEYEYANAFTVYLSIIVTLAAWVSFLSSHDAYDDL